MAQDTLISKVGLPLRPCVGIMLINRFGQIWTGRRAPKWLTDKSAYIWQMPQGGIERGESPREAAFRELKEETSARSVELLAEANQWRTYELPPHLLGIALKGRYRGQSQLWYAMRFNGPDSEIDIGPRKGVKPEFDAWRWSSLCELPEYIVPFKRTLYESLIEEFGHLAR